MVHRAEMNHVQYKVWSNALVLREFTANDLVRVTGLKPSSVHTVLDRMKRENLISPSQREKRRVVYRLTEDSDALERLTGRVEDLLPPLPPDERPSSSYYRSAQRRLDQATGALGAERQSLLAEAEQDLESAEQAEGGSQAPEPVRAFLQFERARLAYLSAEFAQAKSHFHELREVFVSTNDDQMIGRIDDFLRCLEFQEWKRSAPSGADEFTRLHAFIQTLVGDNHPITSPVVLQLVELTKQALVAWESKAARSSPSTTVTDQLAASTKELLDQAQQSEDADVPSLARLLALRLAGQGAQAASGDARHETGMSKDKQRRARTTKSDARPNADASQGMGAGIEELATAVSELTAAGAMEDIAAVELAAGVADLTRAADAAVIADRMGQLSEVVAAAGDLDIAQAIHLLSASEDVAVMGAVVGVMSASDLEHGLQLARLSGELRVAGDIVDLLEMPVLAGFLESRGERVNGMAVNAVLRSTSTRVLAAAMAATGTDLAELSAENVADGIVRLAAADAMAVRSGELAMASAVGAVRGVEEVATAAVLDQAARELTAAAATDAVVGGAKFVAAEAEAALAEAQRATTES